MPRLSEYKALSSMPGTPERVLGRHGVFLYRAVPEIARSSKVVFSDGRMLLVDLSAR
jgi:hypothetical protein